MPFVGRLLTQLVHVNVLDTATRMAAQIFLTAVPTVFILAAFAPDSARNNLVESLRGALGLRPTSLDEFQQIFNATSETVRDATGGIGIVVTLLSATACSRVLQRLCERSWHMSHTGARVAAWRWLAWLLVWLAALLFQGRIHAAFGAGSGLGTALSLVSGTLLWWWTQHVLLGGRIRWLPLLPGAVITGAGLLVFFWASKIYMPHAFDRSITQFGPFGLVFTLLSWLIMICVTITVCIATGYVVASEGHLARLLGTPSAENAAQSAVRTAD
ncbi:YhjD/YihY/BrkB family envelope integrity protein [Streptomyces kaniharaensis]|uniref:YhjD/YihY/BrkB family envelope integrity protein n=1 Tax=Streptomyces kaniharaensis TaxID=212423 RepID=UPI002DDCFF22|nr:YhjD/YihY/BrkB family envelope integrity protein [Streptomyces kaniharaensis]